MSKHFCDLLKARCPNLFAEPITIYDIGSRDCRESVDLAGSFPYAQVVAFEPNPKTLPLCLKATIFEPRIRVVGAAVSDHNGEATLYQATTWNQGYSSLYKSSGKYDHIEPMPSVPVQVPCIRLDQFIERNHAKPPTLLWADMQGSELAMLRGLGPHLANVKAMWSEVLYGEMYSGQCTRDQLVSFMQKEGFTVIHEEVIWKDKRQNWWGDACFYRE